MVANPLTLIMQDLLPGDSPGIERYCGEVLNAFRRRGLRFQLRTITAREFHIGRLRFGYYPRIAWNRLIVRPGGVVHSFFWFIMPPSTRIVTFWDRFSLRHNPANLAERWLHRQIRRDLRERPEVYVAISEAARRDLHDELGVSWDRIEVAPPGVDTERFRPLNDDTADPRGAGGKRTLLHVGLGYRRKGIHILVEALAQLGAGRFRLVRVGPPRDPEYVSAYRRRAREVGLELVELGRIPDEALAAQYRLADLLVFPSADEGAGMPPLEAMACGTNAVVSDIPSHRELCGGQAFLAQPEPEPLAAAIERALTSPKNPRDLRRHAERFSWSATAEAYLRVYDRMGVPTPERDGSP